MADPARAAKLGFIERRKRSKAACRAEPCFPVRSLLAGGVGYPPCVLCVHEAKITKAKGEAR